MRTMELDAPPGTGTLLVKAALGALPLGPLGALRRRATELPDTELVLPSVRVDPEHLAAYARVCGFGLRDELPPTYPHVLAFPLAMRLMADGSFPFPMIGLVHVRNAITVACPLRLDEPFGLRVRVTGLRQHERGRQFDVVHEATVDGEVRWRDVSTYLRRERTPASGAKDGGGSTSGGARGAGGHGVSGGRKHGGGSTAGGLKSVAGPVEQPVAVWRVGEDAGRRYAAVSGDRNPIHLHALAARALGFPRAIAHGMWSKARCLAALEGRLPAAYTVDVSFRLPVLLPAKVAFTAEPTDPAGADGAAGWRFALHDARSGKPHLAGTVVAA